jgi:hypothetical protein
MLRLSSTVLTRRFPITECEVDYQLLFNLAVALAAFFGGWTLNNITKTLERLDQDVRDFHRDFVDKETYHRDIDEIKDICKQIFAKLDNKADKA